MAANSKNEKQGSARSKTSVVVQRKLLASVAQRSIYEATGLGGVRD